MFGIGKRDKNKDKNKDSKCCLILMMIDGTIYADMQIDKSTSSTSIGTVLGVVATGEILDLVLSTVRRVMTENGRIDEIADVFEVTKSVSEKYMDNLNVINKDPVVSPRDAMAKLSGFYQK